MAFTRFYDMHHRRANPKPLRKSVLGWPGQGTVLQSDESQESRPRKRLGWGQLPDLLCLEICVRVTLLAAAAKLPPVACEALKGVGLVKTKAMPGSASFHGGTSIRERQAAMYC
ncbi:hypothetical protein H6P81_007332 [Aristolochia fimbriata]|uniref:Uncharacterized protein n=1 Tax=Aristolochia fimbriata TaxID=158543 RepID=A0AAV7F4E3_ARIFI|nr:hypothetical protein H6P81_007332 [Aristolochia fimbriata]